jgi:phage replication-related protein YjqB (UPF0714/DUF867 family)
VVWVGGADDSLVDRAILEFSATGYQAKKDSFTPGTESRNVCNRGRRGRGLQLELAEVLRRRFFRNLTRAGRQHTTPELAHFASVVRKVIHAAE